jgi:endonuclease YncB( thermonuclease family)
MLTSSTLSLCLLVVSTSALAFPGAVQEDVCQEGHDDSQTRSAPRTNWVRAPRVGQEGILEGTLLWVTDGDSLHALVKDTEMELRLADVDAPERAQAYGWEAKLTLIDLVRGKHIVFAPREVDRHGRIVARVWIDELDVNRELLKRGAAWFYPAYAEDATLSCHEQLARAAKIGLWALASPRVEPWEWRRREREQNPGPSSRRSDAESH